MGKGRKMHEKPEASFRTEEAKAIDLSWDCLNWIKLSDNERSFFKHLLVFYSTSDTYVNENVEEHIMNEVKVPEFKMCMKNSHSEMYSLLTDLVDTFIEDDEECEKLWKALIPSPAVQKKAKFARKWLNSGDTCYSERVVAFAVMQRIFFSGSFAAIFWLKKRDVMREMTSANDLIFKMSDFRTEFARTVLFPSLVKKPDKEKVLEIVKEAVDIECEIFKDALPVALIGMKADVMTQYIQFEADRLLGELGQDKYYDAVNPLLQIQIINTNKRRKREAFCYAMMFVLWGLWFGCVEFSFFVFLSAFFFLV